MNVSDRSECELYLAIETTGRGGSLALFDGPTVVQSAVLEPDQRAAATLAPLLDQMLARGRKSDRGKIEQVSVADGPGSFTGLRIAVTTAKTLAYALKIRLVAVDSLAAIAAATFHDHPTVARLVVALDAYRGQVFWGQFDRATLLPEDAALSNWSCHPACIVAESIEAFAVRIAGDLADTMIAGDVKPFGARAAELLPRSCDAIGVGLLGGIAAERNEFTDPMTLIPRYLKVSAAEENASR